MKRALIISIIVLLVVVILGGFSLLLFSKSKSTVQNTVNTESVASENTNTPGRIILTREEKGNIEVNKTLSYKGADLKILNAAELDAFHGQSAKPGNKFVLLFMAPVQSAATDPNDWIGREGKIVSSTGNSYSILESQLVGEGANVNTGYLWFEAKNDDHNFRLVFSTKEQEAAIELGF